MVQFQSQLHPVYLHIASHTPLPPSIVSVSDVLVKSHTCPELASFPSELVYEEPTAVKIVDTEIGRDTETFFNPAPAKAFPPCLFTYCEPYSAAGVYCDL